MAKKGKSKISKVKRNNQTTNKMRKQGKMKLQRHGFKNQKQKQPTQQPQVEYSSDSDNGSGDEWKDMLDDEEQQYILSRLSKQPQLLSNVPENEKPNRKSKKRKRENKEKPIKKVMQASDSGAETDESDSDLEDKYEKELSERPPKKLRPLLPIKTKQGLVEREEEVVDTDSDADQDQKVAKPADIPATMDSEADSDDSGMEVVDDGDASEEVVSAVELLAARRDRLNNDKLRIGALCSSLLESPDKKLKNLFPILYLMEERLKDGTLNLHSIRKLATLSAFEVFKDILPDYLLRHQDYSNVKLKKDTLSLYKYEKELLEFYKRYLQRLEKAAAVLRPKKGDTRKLSPASSQLGLVSLRCLCGLLVARPGFNYATNIAQSVVPFLAHEATRPVVTQCAADVFRSDYKGEITLAIVRLINQLVKRRGERLPAAALDCLLALRIQDVDMNAQGDISHKKKLDQKHKKRIVNLSKKEKKRAKKLKEVERELLETEAQESEIARRKQMTEVTKTVFQIYFRLLKTAPRSQLLIAALNGIAKFTHVINLEYYSDLVRILARLVADELVGRRARLLVVRAVLGVLAGAGDALNIDPATFHQYLYAHALEVHAGASQGDARIVLEGVQQICGRARRVAGGVLQAFAKRLATLALQLQHHGALGCLLLLHHLAKGSAEVSSLLEAEAEAGAGRFAPEMESPEHCGASGALLAELAALRTHYHPAVGRLARAVLVGTLPPDFHNTSPVQAFEAYDGSQMAFKPAIPPPKRDEKQKAPSHHHSWAQPSLKALCEAVETNTSLLIVNT